MTSVFTKIIRNELKSYKVWDENEVLAILDIAPINKGHLLVIPHEEVADIFDLPEARYQQLWKVVRYLSSILKEVTQAPRIGIAVEGFAVPHAHIHLVPIYKGNELNPERAQKASVAQLSEMHQKLLAALHKS